MSETNEYRQDKINGMRELLTLLEAQPTIPLPSFYQINVFVWESDDDALPVKTVARAMKPVNKLSEGDYYILEREFTGGVKLHVNYSRKEVCARVVTGTEEIPARMVKAYTREIVEWVCPPSIMDDDETVEPVETHELTDAEGDATLEDANANTNS